MYVERETETDRQAGRQADIKTETETLRDRDRERETETETERATESNILIKQTPKHNTCKCALNNNYLMYL